MQDGLRTFLLDKLKKDKTIEVIKLGNGSDNRGEYDLYQVKIITNARKG